VKAFSSLDCCSHYVPALHLKSFSCHFLQCFIAGLGISALSKMLEVDIYEHTVATCSRKYIEMGYENNLL